MSLCLDAKVLPGPEEQHAPHVTHRQELAHQALPLSGRSPQRAAENLPPVEGRSQITSHAEFFCYFMIYTFIVNVWCTIDQTISNTAHTRIRLTFINSNIKNMKVGATCFAFSFIRFAPSNALRHMVEWSKHVTRCIYFKVLYILRNFHFSGITFYTSFILLGWKYCTFYLVTLQMLQHYVNLEMWLCSKVGIWETVIWLLIKWTAN